MCRCVTSLYVHNTVKAVYIKCLGAIRDLTFGAQMEQLLQHANH